MGQQQAKEWKEAGMWADMAACQGQLDCLTTNKNTMSECPRPRSCTVVLKKSDSSTCAAKANGGAVMTELTPRPAPVPWGRPEPWTQDKLTRRYSVWAPESAVGANVDASANGSAWQPEADANRSDDSSYGPGASAVPPGILRRKRALPPMHA